MLGQRGNRRIGFVGCNERVGLRVHRGSPGRWWRYTCRRVIIVECVERSRGNHKTRCDSRRGRLGVDDRRSGGWINSGHDGTDGAEGVEPFAFVGSHCSQFASCCLKTGSTWAKEQSWSNAEQLAQERPSSWSSKFRDLNKYDEPPAFLQLSRDRENGNLIYTCLVE